MASYEILKEIVSNGSNLVLYKGISYDVIIELAQIAQRTGAKLTVPTSMSYDIIRELSAIGGNSITFLNSLDVITKAD
jgi:hypothetical protein